MQKNKNRSFTIFKPYTQNYLSNFSNQNQEIKTYNSNISDHSLQNLSASNVSDNELELKSSRSNKSHYSSLFSNEISADNLTESFSTEQAMIMQNPNDSMEFNIIAEKFDFNTIKKNLSTIDKSNEQLIENIDRTNNILKQLIKEGDINLSISNNVHNFDSQGVNLINLATTKEDFMDYLYINKFNILYEKLKAKELDLKGLVCLSDNKILKMIENDNIKKFDELRSIIMKLDDDFNGDDVLKSIENFNSDFKDELNFELEN
jgi:hypothetical protein